MSKIVGKVCDVLAVTLLFVSFLFIVSCFALLYGLLFDWVVSQ